MSLFAPRRPVRAATAVAVTTLIGVLLLAATASADRGKFQWTKNGNNAAAKWKSFEDNDAYMTVNTEARQRRGNRAMYVRVDMYSLRCSGGQNTCYSVSAGGVIGLNEGAEWHQISHKRHASMYRGRSRTQSASTPLDPDSTLMQARIYICYNRNITPDPCSRPRYGTMRYNDA